MKTSPAFMFYASDAIADKNFRLMSLGERGLYLSMLCECWVNHSVPASNDALAKWLGFQTSEIQNTLTPRVLEFFTEENGELKSPELERYRKELEDRRKKQSIGGKKGAEKKWHKPGQGNSLPSGLPNRVSMGPRVEMSRVEISRSESLGKPDISDPWITDYDQASNGG